MRRNQVWNAWLCNGASAMKKLWEVSRIRTLSVGNGCFVSFFAQKPEGKHNKPMERSRLLVVLIQGERACGRRNLGVVSFSFYFLFVACYSCVGAFYVLFEAVAVAAVVLYLKIAHEAVEWLTYIHFTLVLSLSIAKKQTQINRIFDNRQWRQFGPRCDFG